MIYLDFETRSERDISAGTYNYCLDPSTKALMMAWAIDDEPVELWSAGEPLPVKLQQAFMDGHKLVAVNAVFDRLVFGYTFFDTIIEDWICASAWFRVNGLPASLENAGIAINSDIQKDFRGKQLIKECCQPPFNDHMLPELGDYCIRDVEAMRDIIKCLRPMSDDELNDYWINEHVNDRGVLIDEDTAACAQAYFESERGTGNQMLAKITEGKVTATTQTAKLTEWIRSVDPDLLRRHLILTPKGKVKLDRQVRSNMLNDDDCHYLVREVLTLVESGSASSVSKFKRMCELADDVDGRCRGAFIYAGAASTKRYTSRGLQLHNMSRDCFDEDEMEEAIADLKDGTLPVTDLKKMLRGCLMAPDDREFAVADWAAIEARGLPYLSGNAEHILDIFRDERDIYVETASSMEIGSRFIGKVATLSLGYGGADGAFMAMAKNYGLTIAPKMVSTVVRKWRKANPWAVDFWAALERAARRAIARPEQIFTAGLVEFSFFPRLLGGTLICGLPCGTLLQYPQARIEDGGVTALKASIVKKKGDDEWGRVRLWGGLIAENVTQAFCASLLRHAIRKLHEKKIPVVAHVHDEIIAEVEYEHQVDTLQEVMETPPSWAKGLPLKAEPEIMSRYGK